MKAIENQPMVNATTGMSAAKTHTRQAACAQDRIIVFKGQQNTRSNPSRRAARHRVHNFNPPRRYRSAPRIHGTVPHAPSAMLGHQQDEPHILYNTRLSRTMLQPILSQGMIAKLDNTTIHRVVKTNDHITKMKPV